MVWTPGYNGFAQSEYRDQMGSALPGEIAYSSENELIDSGVVIEATSPNGIPAGRGVFYRAQPTVTGHREATNNWGITLGEATDTIATFAGVSVRAHQMDGAADTGEAIWAPKRMANYLRYSRVGGRIWVELDPAEADVERVCPMFMWSWPPAALFRPPPGRLPFNFPMPAGIPALKSSPPAARWPSWNSTTSRSKEE